MLKVHQCDLRYLIYVYMRARIRVRAVEQRLIATGSQVNVAEQRLNAAEQQVNCDDSQVIVALPRLNAAEQQVKSCVAAVKGDGLKDTQSQGDDSPAIPLRLTAAKLLTAHRSPFLTVPLRQVGRVRRTEGVDKTRSSLIRSPLTAHRYISGLNVG